MNNEKGSILVITAGFALVFSLLGIASIYFAGLQNESAEKQKMVNEAFWLADGGIEKARSRLPEKVLGTSQEPHSVSVDQSRSYEVSTVELKKNRWKVNAIGTVNGHRREIEVEIEAPETEEIVKNVRKCTAVACGVSSGFELCVGYPHCSFEDVFPEYDFQGVIDGATHYNIAENLSGLSGVSFIKVVSGASTIPLPVEGKGFLVMDVTAANNNGNIPVIFDMQNAEFAGIIWINGDARIENPNLDGVLIARAKAGSVAAYTSVFNDKTIIEESVSLVTGKPSIVAWREK